MTPHKRSAVTMYCVIYVALLMLLALTVEAARHDLGRWNFLVALLIASAKAVLIALFFMHVRHGAPLVKLVVAASLLWLAIMFSLSLADYWTRNWDRLIGGSSHIGPQSRSDP
jgi:cytochrome c oxidase subunit 4